MRERRSNRRKQFAGEHRRSRRVLCGFAKFARSRLQLNWNAIDLFIPPLRLSIYLDCAPQTLPIRARIANSALNKNVWRFNLFAHNFNAPITTCSARQEEMCKSNFYGVRLLKCTYTTNSAECAAAL